MPGMALSRFHMCSARLANSCRIVSTQAWSPFRATARACWQNVAVPLVVWLWILAMFLMISSGPAA